jgi:NAD(P)-dependent dehydrogenase (short-subunit alcohol dehydrogenase family)
VTSNEGRFQCSAEAFNQNPTKDLFSPSVNTRKQSEHPHTNMAKAALNMLTLTSSRTLLSQGVLMCAVDPGWVSEMRSLPHVARNPLKIPFEFDDATSRILQPLIEIQKEKIKRTEPLNNLNNAVNKKIKEENDSDIMQENIELTSLSGALLRHYRMAPW